MLTLFGATLPNWATIVASSTDYSNGFFTEFLPLIFLVIGIVVAVTLLKFLGGSFIHGIKHLTVSNEEREAKAGSWEASRAMFRDHNR